MDALVPIEEKQVLFYEDEITAVRLEDGRVFIPIRPLVERLGIDWAGQLRRIRRDAVLSEEVMSVDVTSTDIDNSSKRPRSSAMMCLPLDFVSGFLFSINANRVRAELKDRIIRYQRECYRVLAEAFQSGRLTSSEVASDSPAAVAYQIATAVAELARNQMQLETAVAKHDQRLELIEAQLGNPERFITDAQASEISQAVKAIALVLSKASGSNQYGSVYGEFYRKQGVSSYKRLPAAKFDEAMEFLTEWHQSLVGDSPF